MDIVLITLFFPYMNMAFSSCTWFWGVNSIVPSISQFNPLAIVTKTINSINRIIQTISKHIIAQQALAGAYQCIGVDKSPHCGIVVPTLEVVEVSFGIVDVSSVSQGIDCAKGVCHGAGDGEDLTPGVIGVFHLYIAVGIDDRYHIALEVSDVVINIIAVCYRTIAEIKGFSGGLQVL